MLAHEVRDGINIPATKTTFGRYAEAAHNLGGRIYSSPGAILSARLVGEPKVKLSSVLQFQIGERREILSIITFAWHRHKGARRQGIRVQTFLDLLSDSTSDRMAELIDLIGITS